MIDHANELRQLAADCYWPTSPVSINELLDHLEAAEKSGAESIAMYRKAQSVALITRLAVRHEADCVDAAKAEIEALRSKITEMEQQEPVAGGWRCDNGHIHGSCEKTLPMGAKLYGLAGTQPAPSVPVEAIGKMLADAMAVAVSNGANSVSMPDEYVEVAVWLRGISSQPTPSVPKDFSREELEAVAAGLDTYEKTVNVGNVTGEGDDHLESTTAYAARFIRAMIALAPEAKS